MLIHKSSVYLKFIKVPVIDQEMTQLTSFDPLQESISIRMDESGLSGTEHMLTDDQQLN